MVKKKIDPADGCKYSLSELQEHYGGKYSKKVAFLDCDSPKDGPPFFGGGLGLSTGGIAWKVPRRARIEVELTVITLLQESFRVL